MIPSKSFKCRHSAARTILHSFQIAFLVIGILGLGSYGYVQLQARAFQAYQNWRLDQLQQGKPASISLFVKQWIPISWTEEPTQPTQIKQPEPQPGSHGGPTGSGGSSNTPSPEKSQAPQSVPPPAVSEGSLIGRIKIPRIDLSAIVLEGIGAQTLRLAVGHLPGTPLPGGKGNIDLAAHRDTFFRGLRKIQKGDTITLSTLSGAQYQYRVGSITVVSPNNTEILNASEGPGLNLITCFPFNYIGPAPRRFVVHADEIGDTASHSGSQTSSDVLPVSLHIRPSVSAHSSHAHIIRKGYSRAHRRSSAISGTRIASRGRAKTLSPESSQLNNSPSPLSRPARFRAFFQKVFRRNRNAGS